jgi:trimeric autotransporter adhesin
MQPAIRRIALFFVFAVSFQKIIVAQAPANDLCSSLAAATPLTSAITCVTTPGTLKNATATTTASLPAAVCGNSTSVDVWYKFVAQSGYPTVTLGGIGASLNTAGPRIQILSAVCNNTATVYGCGASPLRPTSALSANTTYYIRITTNATGGGTGGTATAWDFNICITDPPVNDSCAAATLLTSNTSCANTTGTLLYSTATTSLAACGNTNSADVWYKFVAKSIFPTVTLSNVGANLTTAVPYTQIFSGACGALTQNVCGTTLITRPSTALTIGDTYYVRVTTNAATVPSSGAWGFDICVTDPPPVVGSAMNEVFKQTLLVPASNPLNDPWEITYGSDGFLWITIAKDYKVLRMDPATGAYTTVLDISPTGTGYLTSTEHTNYNRLNWTTTGSIPWPQGGLMGLALHPDFMNATTPKKYVYLGYVRSQGSVPTDGTGQYYTNFLVRFIYNTGTGKLESPVTLCDTLPGSKDHNSGRLITAPIGGVNYLFYSSGDMGSGQYENLTRPVKVQNINCYEGKILRFNLEEDGDAVQNTGVRNVNYNRWIPSGAGAAGNPYNTYLGVQSAVWNMGHRNVQGFATGNFGGTDYIYGSSHGPMSDDEINIMEAGKNYGHPLVIGYSADGNYNEAKAGPVGGSLPLLSATGEADNVTAINALPFGSGYKDPIYSFYPVPKGSTTTCSPGNNSPFVASVCNVQDVYRNCGGTGNNNFWKSEAPSGMGIYTQPLIPGWKNSLLLASLKWGRMVRVKLNGAGTGIVPTNGVDTIPYFKSQNRYRDMAVAPDGKDIFIINDKSTSTSGPSQDNPSTINCGGCVVKYTFMGYNDNTGASSIPTYIPISPGLSNALTNGTPTVIYADNNDLWVPVTDSLGNIIAEIDANGNNLGNVTATLYKHSGTIRRGHGNAPYLDRSITINVQNQPSTAVNVRLYLTTTELNVLVAASGGSIASINDVNVFKNTDANGIALTAVPANITPTARTAFGSDYVLKASISSFSTFYFGGALSTLPIDLITLNGKYNDQSVLLNWKTATEVNSSHFSIERSDDGRNYKAIGTVAANGNSLTPINYSYLDFDAVQHSARDFNYRLKIFDNNGTYKYSNAISVSLPGSIGTVSIFPNPVGNDLKAAITSPVTGTASWRIIDNTGRTILYSNTLLRKGSNTLSINTDKLPVGSYYLYVAGDGINVKTKFQKL